MADNEKLKAWADQVRVAASWVGTAGANVLNALADDIEAEAGITKVPPAPPQAPTPPAQVNVPNAPPAPKP